MVAERFDNHKPYDNYKPCDYHKAQSPHEVSTPIPQQVILYSGEPLSNQAEMAYLNTVQKVIPFYLNVSVLQISQTGYQMYSDFFLTLRTLSCCAGVDLRKRQPVKNAHKFAFNADKKSYRLGHAYWYNNDFWWNTRGSLAD